MISRRALLAGAGLTGLAAAGAGTWLWNRLRSRPAEVGFAVGNDKIARAMEFLARHPAIDAHAHPGRTFVRGAGGLNWQMWIYQRLGTFEERVIEDMRAGGLAAACFSAVSDFPVLAPAQGGLASVRPFRAGEAWNYYKAQIANLKALAASGLVHPVLAPADIEAARAAGLPGAIFAMEGADFVEDDPKRIATAHSDGVRMVTLVHYVTGGKIGDIMTAPPVHNGLTGLGREVVAAVGEAGIMLDLSHASEKTAFGALAIAKGPAVATHTHLNSLGIGHPRFISDELAQAIAATGGYVGAWPAGIGMTTLDAFVDRILALAGKIGIAHVAIGTDMDANYKPVFETYRKLPLIVARLLERGMAEADVAAVVGGNFMRVFAAGAAA
jgi:membrane dipeptidase